MSELIPISDDERISREAPTSNGPVVGQWYWLTVETPEWKRKNRKIAESQEYLVCAMQIGTNYVKVESPQGSSWRVHLANFWTELRHEPNADKVIRKFIGGHQERAQELLGEVKELTARLGMVAPTEAQAGQNALAVISGTTDIKAYGTALVLAKEKQLPELFKEIGEEHERLATWMKAPSLPMMAQLGLTKASVGDIDDRIFSINLYAGLTEQVEKCCNGKPAAATEKLHVMQRMLFMDEESLLDWKTGGMEFKNINEFDDFMCKPVNRDRILPHPRTLVAMRVRRTTKDRDSYGQLSIALLNFELAEADKCTFLYIRNGEQVWRLSCDMDFGELIFPDKTLYDPLEPKMVKGHTIRDIEFMSVHEWDERMARRKESEKKAKEWKKSNPGKSDWDSPHYRSSDWTTRELDEYKPLDHDNVYYDEAMAKIEKDIKKYNRVALIIQGLYDRSLVLHPHPPVKSWTAEGFDSAITLVNDSTTALNYGEPPDFEAYRSRINSTLKTGSIVVGQQDAWQAVEAVKENARMDADYRHKRSDYRPRRYKPYGDPGPADPGPVASYSKAGAVFKWAKARETNGGSWKLLPDQVTRTIRISPTKLLNVDAYQIGDFKQFFQDPRTRARYLQWAPLLLAAEDYKRTNS